MMPSRRAIVATSLFALLPASAWAAELLATSAPDAIELSNPTTRVALQVQRHDAIEILSVAERRRITLVCSGIVAARPPGVPFSLYLNVAEGVSPHSDDAGFVGAVSFFDVAPPGSAGRRFSFDVSAVLQRIKGEGRLRSPLSVTLLSRRKAAVGSQPRIRTIELFAF